MAETEKKFHINPYVMVILSFALVILTGSLLLCMPWARTCGRWGFWDVESNTYYIDHLFSAVSATCVTGADTLQNSLCGEYTIGGQIVMMLMIQIGGLGFITVLTFILTLFKKKLQFKDRYILSQAINSTSIADVTKFVRKIIIIAGVAELVGFLLGLPAWYIVCKKDFGSALWNSLFFSVSAFNNAGFDVFSSSSLNLVGGFAEAPLWCYYYICSVVMLLIISGGLSFLVIIDIFGFKRPSQWRAFTKITLCMTGFLLLAGFSVLMISEVWLGNNGFTPFDAIFTSVTARTAGFLTINPHDMSVVGKVTCMSLMFIGGSPLSTAGGIKITTIYMIGLAMVCYFRGKPVSSFKRVYSTQMVIKAMSLFLIALGVVLISFLFLKGFEAGNMYEIDGQMVEYRTEDLFLEIFSTFGTTGFSTYITGHLRFGSKILLCILMFLGRLGPMTFFQIFQTNMDKEDSSNSHYKFVEEDFLIG